MSKEQLQLYFYQFNDPNHEHYLDNAWWAGIINTYLQEL
jgi:hypothetical protein